MHLGQTRSAFRHDHLLQTPDTFVRTQLPGMERAAAIVHCGPALGARFSQYSAEIEEGGILGPTGSQRFFYVLQGSLIVETSGHRRTLEPGAFAFFPQGCEHRCFAATTVRMTVVEKKYVSALGMAIPEPVIGHESAIPPQSLMGDEALQVRSLLPSGLEFDFAVNTMTYEPGASLSMVEIHVMEHGLLMLQGEGIYRLGERWYAVAAGDFIWMRSFCPQWFGALGKTPAKYLIYKDWNRSA